MATVSFGWGTPTAATDTTTGMLAVGTKFHCNTAGNVTSLMYYEQSATAGTVTVKLYNSSSTAIATATHTAVNGQSGWRTLSVTAVALSSGSDYMLVCYVPSAPDLNNKYGTDNTNTLGTVRYTAGSELETIDDGVRSFLGGTGNGCYAYSATTSTIPTNTFGSSNYGVDLVFETGPTEKSDSDTAHGEDAQDLDDGSIRKSDSDYVQGDDNSFVLDTTTASDPVDVDIFPSAYGNQSGTTWSGQTNMYADDGAYASWTSTTANAVGYIETNTFDFSAIPADATINSVTAKWNLWVTNATRVSSVTGRLYLSGVGQGSGATTLTRPTADGTTQTQEYTGLTRADLANLSLRATFTRYNGTSSGIGRIDVMYLTVNYTPAGGGVTSRAITTSSDVSRATDRSTLDAEEPGGDASKGGPDTSGTAEATSLSVTTTAADTRPAVTEASILAVQVTSTDTAHGAEGNTQAVRANLFEGYTPGSWATNSLNYCMGTKFKPKSDGKIVAIRYYHGGTQNGTCTMRLSLWNNSGSRIATGTLDVTAATSVGWKTVPITPTDVTADTTYMVTMYSGIQNFYFATTAALFGSVIENSYLYAFAYSDAVEGNGWYGDCGYPGSETYPTTKHASGYGYFIDPVIEVAGASANDVNGPDSGSTAEGSSLAAALSGSDVRTATEAASLAATSSTPDTRPAATEAASLAATAPTQGDARPAATSGQSLAATMAAGDTRPAPTEAVTLTVVLATGDTAQAVEGQTAQDLGNVAVGADSLPAATEGQSLVAQVTPQESASGATQTASVAAQVGSVQPGAGSEQASLLASVPSQPESSGHTEAATLVVSVTAADIAACAEAVSLLASLSGSDSRPAASESHTLDAGGAKQVVEDASTLESGSVARTSSTGETRPVADSASLLATPPGQSQAGVSYDSAVLAVQITQVQLCSATEAAALESSMVADEPVEFAEQALLVAVISASDLVAAAEATTLIHGGARNWRGISATSDAEGVMTVNVQLSGGREATIRIKRLEG